MIFNRFSSKFARTSFGTKFLIVRFALEFVCGQKFVDCPACRFLNFGLGAALNRQVQFQGQLETHLEAMLETFINYLRRQKR